jgi:hypothetical protein
VRFAFKTEIGLSAQVPHAGDPAAVAAAAAAFGEAGAALVIVTLPPLHTPAVLEPLASALAELPAAALSGPGGSAA